MEACPPRPKVVASKPVRPSMRFIGLLDGSVRYPVPGRINTDAAPATVVRRNCLRVNDGMFGFFIE